MVTRQPGGMRSARRRRQASSKSLRCFVSSSFQTVIQSSGAAMAGNQAQHQRGLVVMVEVSPVHRYQNRLARPDLVRDPAGKALPHVDPVVAEQPVHLLDRMLGD